MIVHLPWAQRDRRLTIALLIVVALLVAAVGVRAIVSTIVHPSSLQASGTIEATQSDVAPKVEGRLVDLRVRDGDTVKRGQLVAELEAVEPGLNLAQARANVSAAAAAVAIAQSAYELQSATYDTSVAQAGEGVGIASSRLGQANVAYGMQAHTATLEFDQAQAQQSAAQSTYDRATIDLHRAKILVASGDLAQQALDDATAAYRTATAQLRVAQDSVATARENLRTIGVRALDIAASSEAHQQSIATLTNAQAQQRLIEQRRSQVVAAQAQLAQARAALGLAQDRVRETRLVAPFDGVVISHNFENGDLIEPGAPVLTIGDLVHPYAYVYIPENQLPKVKTGANAKVTIDGIPGRAFQGAVTEIASAAEFTPENVQTKEERIEYLVFRVKLQFTDTTGLLKPGLPVDAAISI